MTNKEFIQEEIYWIEDLLEQAKRDNRNTVIPELEDEIKQYSQVLKDLEELEELKKIMGTPIQDIMKRLKVLEILKPYIELSSDGIISCHNLILIPYYKDYEEQYNLLKEWLDDK